MDRQAAAQEFADYLIDGYWADRGWHSRQWETTEITYSVGDGFDDADATAIAAALEAWSDVSALSFREVPSDGALSFQDGSDGKAWNLTASFRSGEILWSKVSIDTSVSGWRDLGEPGGSGYFTLLHEIGHALGLGHPGNYNGGIVTRDQAHLADDSQQFSVMSYFGAFFTGANHQLEGELLQASTPLLYDILAIQRLYGPNLTAFQGDTVHTLDAGAVRTIWDAGGEDVLDFSDQAADQRISLEAGSFSDVGGMRGNLSIAFGTEIEAARGGAGDDAISGNALDNILQGGGGNDTFFGGEGADTFVFGEAHGHDRIADFTSGIDRLDLSGALVRAVDASADGLFLETSQGSILLEGLGVEAFSDLDLLREPPTPEVAAATPPVAGPVGEVGAAVLGARPVWIPFTQALDSPVVIARIQNSGVSETAVVRIIETTDEGFRAMLQTPNASTERPQETNIAFLAIEEGTHTLSARLARSCIFGLFREHIENKRLIDGQS